MFSEVLAYHDHEAIYFEHLGKEDGVVRLAFEMLEGLKIVEDEVEPEDAPQERESNSREPRGKAKFAPFGDRTKYSDQRSRSCQESAIASPRNRPWSCHNAVACG
jgi:hypothetical protein